LNRQGADKGTQYRSAIFYLDEDQRDRAIDSKNNVAVKLWEAPIVTEITEASRFYKAEVYHQDYYNANRTAPYCSVVINPKVSKLKQKFANKLKPEYV
jgi:peptide-methionine (S)-S-oxide reductase